MEFCPHCMRPASGKFCTSCGGELNWKAAPGQLALGTLLQGSDNHTYQVGAARGQGGFGITYAAMDLTTAKRVAIKEYYPTRCASRTQMGKVTPLTGQAEFYEGGLKSFLEEARMLSAVGALPSVVSVRDYFEANGTAYLVMEYVDGVPLHEIVSQRGKIPAAELLPMLPELLRDLAVLHKAGVIHRDISPDNLILMPNGKLKILDFGSARSIQDGKSMTVLLKAGFSPVEQYQSRGQGPWTDVYAMAGTIYYCLTGVIPPSAVDRLDEDTLQRPTTLGAALTPAQEEALLWGLVVQPRSRPADMEIFARRLFPEEKDPKPIDRPYPPPPKSSRKKWIVGVLAGAAGVVILVGICLALFSGGSGNDGKRVSTPPSSPPAATQPSTEPTAPPTTAATEPELVQGETEDGYRYVLDGDRCILTGYTGSEALLFMPDDVDGVSITGIGEGAFASLTDVESVYMPIYLEEIQANAFADCTGLRDVYVYGTVSRVDPSAFDGCKEFRCVVLETSGASVDGWPLPSDCMVYSDGMETGAGKLDFVGVSNIGTIYGITDSKNAVVMDIPNDASNITLASSAYDYPVVWIYEKALEGVSSSVHITIGSDTTFPVELFEKADWNWSSLGDTGCNWILSCAVGSEINGERTDAPEIRLDSKVLAAATQRASELAVSYEHTRPDGSKWSTALNDSNVEWSYAHAQICRLSAEGGDIDMDKLEEFIMEFVSYCTSPISDGGDYNGEYYNTFGVALYLDEEASRLYGAMIAVVE